MNHIEAMKQALEALESLYISKFTMDDSPINKAITSLRRAIAEAEKQEPVAWRAPNWGHSADWYVYRDFDDPVIGIDGKPSPNNEPLYTHPQPKREWVGLTNEEVVDLVRNYKDVPATLVIATEAKLKEKNT